MRCTPTGAVQPPATAAIISSAPTRQPHRRLAPRAPRPMRGHYTAGALRVHPILPSSSPSPSLLSLTGLGWGWGSGWGPDILVALGTGRGCDMLRRSEGSLQSCASDVR